MLTTLLVLALSFGIYWYILRPKQYWASKGLKYIQPWPLVGNFWRSTLKQRSFGEDFLELYRKYPNEKVYGIYPFNNRMYMCRDPDIVRQTTIKDFEYFLDHVDNLFREDIDPLFGKNLFALKGNRWRNMRATLSPAFTGSKMRGMFQFMDDCGKQFVKHYSDEYEKSAEQNKKLEVDLKNLFTRYTNDIIASTAFGIKTDSFGDPNNTFFKMGQEATKFSLPRLVLLTAAPFLMKLFKITLLSAKLSDFFEKLVKETLKTRRRDNIVRPDMIHLLLEAQKGTLNHEAMSDEKSTGFAVVEESQVGKGKDKIVLTDLDITAQAFIFFLAGFETASVSMCFGTMELALNKELQRKLQEEIDEVFENCNGKFTYETLNKMKYLDMVISESLRKWPPGVATDRKCIKDYHLKVDDKDILVKKGESLSFPVFGFHRDPEYFSDPDKFDPERFSDERKHEIKPNTYLPFGSGPRNCIGSRFALMEAKVALAYIFGNFNIEVAKKTKLPLRLDPKQTNVTIDGGFWVELTPRTKTY